MVNYGASYVSAVMHRTSRSILDVWSTHTSKDVAPYGKLLSVRLTHTLIELLHEVVWQVADRWEVIVRDHRYPGVKVGLARGQPGCCVDVPSNKKHTFCSDRTMVRSFLCHALPLVTTCHVSRSDPMSRSSNIASNAPLTVLHASS